MLSTEQAEEIVDKKMAREAESAQPAETKQEPVNADTPES